MSARSGLGDRIRALREKRDWTQSELARLTGVSQSNINLIESGRRPNITVDTLQKLARVFRVSTDEVLGYDLNAAPLPESNASDRRRIDHLEQTMKTLIDQTQAGFDEMRLLLAPQSRGSTRPLNKPRRRKRP